MALDAGTYTLEVSYNADTSKNKSENYELYFECRKASTVALSEENTLGMGNFQKTATYTDGQFTDVIPNQWFYENVKTAYELGIVKGTDANSYGSKNTVTLAEALALASRLHSIYHTGKADFKQGDVWYQVYLDYAISNGIIRNCGPVIADGEYSGYATTAATREQFVCMMKNAFPDSEFPAINNIEKGKIPDVSTVSFDADAIYTMYNAGIVTGNDGYGTFTPNNTITRSEVAAIIARMVDSSLRKHFTISDKPIEVTGVSLSQTTLSLTIGKTSSIKAYVWPEKATDRAVTWTSSNSKVATVNNGTVSAISAGTATITATTSNGKAASCTVTVKEAGIYDYVAPTVQQYVGGFRTMPVVEDNSVGGVMVKWEADYLGTQNVNYYTVYLTLCDNFGKEVKDVITGKTGVAMKVVGPVKPGGKLMLYNIVGYSPICTVVKIDKIELEFADGTKIIGDYPFTIKGGNPKNDGF